LGTPALVDEKPVRAYVDTGSQLCLMRENDAKDLKLTIETMLNTVEIRGYGDGKLVPLGIIEVQLQVDSATSQVLVHIVTDDAQTIPLIVGQPFTEQPQVVLVKRGDIVAYMKISRRTITYSICTFQYYHLVRSVCGLNKLRSFQQSR